MRTEIDYKGDSHGLGYVDLTTGEFIDCRLFGAVLCNSRLFFPLATLNEKQPPRFAGIREGFKYFGGTTQLLVVDNARCALDKADWFDPDMNQEFYNFCSHHYTTVVAARPGRPRGHSYAVHLLNSGVSISLIAKSLGNSVLVCEKYYLTYSLQEEGTQMIHQMMTSQPKLKRVS
jgi:hypothetical protein